MKRVSAIITAGGQGLRFGGNMPKQFTDLGGMPVLARTLSVFDRMDEITDIVVTVPKEYIQTTKKLLHTYHFQKTAQVLAGGDNRQASVYHALAALDGGTDIVLIHDGVRPFVSERVIRTVIAEAAKGTAAVAGVKMTDTVKETDAEGFIERTVPRERLWSVQTPQGFPYAMILHAHTQAAAENYLGTDDGMLAERFSAARIKMVEGDRTNIKITAPEDMRLGAAMIHMELGI